jgi:hypothetical protein
LFSVETTHSDRQIHYRFLPLEAQPLTPGQLPTIVRRVIATLKPTISGVQFHIMTAVPGLPDAWEGDLEPTGHLPRSEQKEKVASNSGPPESE